MLQSAISKKMCYLNSKSVYISRFQILCNLKRRIAAYDFILVERVISIENFTSQFSTVEINLC